MVEKTRQTFFTTKTLARIGVLGAISAVLYAVPGIPVFPPMYKIDFSTLPALLGGFALGPVAALLILLVKDLTGLLHSSSMGVGELADFLMSGAMCVTAALVYARAKHRKGALTGLALGILAMTAVGAAANYFLLIPFYVQVMHMPEEAIVSLMAKIVPMIDSVEKVVLLATTPFNLLKGVVLGLIAFLMYKPLSPLLHANP